MKRIYPFSLIISIVFYINISAQDAPFSRGVNLTNWFQTSTTTQIQFTKYTKQDFEQIKSLGCDVIRLPINLHFMTDGEPDYIVDTLFFTFLDEVIDWAEKLEMHLIIDNHTFDPATDTDPNVGDILEKVWLQIATHYKNRSNFIYYEILNEPHGITDQQWNSIQQDVIDVIRSVDEKHTIVVGPASWNSYNNLDNMPVYEDTNLIYTFHFYDPFLFTHQGASWTDPSMAPLSGVPFPYNADSMPEFPSSLNGTWIQSNFNNDYPTQGTVEHVKELIDIAVQFKEERNVPLLCGEFGVYIPNCSNSNRIYWYGAVRKYLEENSIAWTIWDYHGGFGLFKEGGNNLFDHDLNILLIDTLGFIIPEQTEFIIEPDSAGFEIYTDYIESRILESSYNDGIINYYSTDKPNNGNYCIYWSDAIRYNNISLDFAPNRDLYYLANNGFALDFFIRGNYASNEIQIQFIDSKTSEPDDHPWRMSYTINNINLSDGYWHHLNILLTDFYETGSWDNTWFNPQDDFDWTAVDRLSFVAENGTLDDKHIWFDNIIITNEDTAQLVDTSILVVPIDTSTTPEDSIPEDTVPSYRNSHLTSSEINIFPNPVNDYLYIELKNSEKIEGLIIDALGREIMKVVVTNNKFVDLSKIEPGIYYFILKSQNNNYIAHKIIKY